MSDYLWDKTGEPEEDVQQLEQLLGTLGYEPRPLQLPEDFGARTTARNSFRQQRPYAWQRLALAASLLLTLLAGAWLVAKFNQREVQHGVAQGNDNAPVNSTTGAQDKAPQQVAPPRETARDNVKEQPAPAAQETPGIARVNYPRPRRVFHRDGAIAQRHAPHAVTERQREQSARADAELKRMQREATEQLLLALRITSAKLNYAQREMQEASARKPETR